MTVAMDIVWKILFTTIGWCGLQLKWSERHLDAWWRSAVTLWLAGLHIRQQRRFVSDLIRLVASVLTDRTTYDQCGLSACHSISLSASRITYCKNINPPISLKLGVMTGPYQSEVLVNFQWWSDARYGFRITFHFPHRCRRADFTRFISISHAVTGWFSRHSVTWLTLTRWWIHNILGAIRQTSRSQFRLIPKAGFESRIAFGWGYM